MELEAVWADLDGITRAPRGRVPAGIGILGIQVNVLMDDEGAEEIRL